MRVSSTYESTATSASITAAAASGRICMAQHTPPPRDYLIEFEDETEATGKSEPMRCPQKYVLRLN